MSTREQEQIAIEEESVRSGVLRYRNRVARLKDRELEDLSHPAVHLMRTYIEPVSKALVQWCVSMANSPGRRATAFPLVIGVDPDVAALLALRLVLASTKSTRVQNLAIAIGASIEQELRVVAFEQQKPTLYKRITQHIAEHPMSFDRSYRQRLWSLAGNRYGIVWQAWSPAQKLSVGMVLIDLIVQHTGLVQIEIVRGRHLTDTKMVLTPTPQALTWINGAHTRCELLHPPRLPMLVPPVPWTNTRDGGYLTTNMKYPLIRGRQGNGTWESLLTMEQMPVVYRAINYMQSIPFKLNRPVLDVLLSLWDNGHPIPGAAARTDIPLPPKPPDIDTNNEARRRWKAEARDVFTHNRGEATKRLSTSTLLSIARRFAQYDEIYFPVGLDFRGRVYYTTSHLHPQASDVGRGLLLFARGVALGANGLTSLKRHLANVYGHDKVSIADQIQWVDQHIDTIMRVVADPLGCRWWEQADKPVQCLAACFEIEAALTNHGGPETYISHLPVQVDCSCNGIQHLAAMSRDSNAGKLVNLLPSPTPQDIYGVVAKETESCLTSFFGCSQESAAQSLPLSSPCSSSMDSGPSSITPPKVNQKTDAEYAAEWLAWGIDRNTAKRPTMVLPYGGTRVAVEDYIREWAYEKDKTNPMPWSHGRDRDRAFRWLAGVMWGVMQRVIGGPMRVMDWTRKIARQVSKAQQPITWVTPSGFVVNQVRCEYHSRVVKTKMGDRIVKLRIGEPTDRIDSRLQAQALAPNLIHSYDAAVLHLALDAMAGAGLHIAAVHDSYSTHAANLPVLVDLLKQTFGAVYKEDRLAQFRSQISTVPGVGELPPAPPMGDWSPDSVLQSDYFVA